MSPGAGGGGRSTPVYRPYRVCAAPKGMVLRRFDLKTDIEFVYLGLESAMVFEQLPEYMKVFVISIPNESERKSNVRIRNGF